MKNLKVRQLNKRIKSSNTTCENKCKLYDIEKHYFRYVFPKIKRAIQEFRKENMQELKKKRIPVLKEMIEMNKTLLNICKLYTNDLDISYLQRKEIKNIRNNLLRWIGKYKAEIKEIKNYKELIKDNHLTELEILTAKNYPISDLLEFNGQNKAYCLWHDDNNPSLHYYSGTNTVYCFSCKKYGDSIAVYMQLYGKTFIESVLELQINLK